jgi:hypothetical protein
MQAAVFLGYISGVFALLFGTRLGGLPGAFAGLGLLAAFGLFGGAFGTANNKRIGWMVLAASACVYGLMATLSIIFSIGEGPISTMFALNASVFPLALVAAALHPHTRAYMKSWFQ